MHINTLHNENGGFTFLINTEGRGMGHDSIRKAKCKRLKVTEAVIDICDL